MLDGCGRNGHLGHTVQMFKNSVVRIYLVLVTGHAIILPKALAENIVVEAESKSNLVLLYLVGRKVWSIFSMQHDNNRPGAKCVFLYH